MDVTSLAALREYLRADREANHLRRSCGYRYLKWLRITRYFYLRDQKALCLVSRVIKNLYGNRYGFAFNYKVPMGKGWRITHNTGVVCYCERAGSDLEFRNFVVIGEAHPGSGNPIIGDDVAFGAGCKVLGAITVGSHVIIGATAVVVHDVPDHSVVAGIPARVIRRTADRSGAPYPE